MSCNGNFATKEDLTQHINISHDNKNKVRKSIAYRIECFNCHEIFPSVRKLKSHVLSDHRLPYAKCWTKKYHSSLPTSKFLPGSNPHTMERKCTSKILGEDNDPPEKATKFDINQNEPNSIQVIKDESVNQTVFLTYENYSCDTSIKSEQDENDPLGGIFP